MSVSSSNVPNPNQHTHQSNQVAQASLALEVVLGHCYEHMLGYHLRPEFKVVLEDSHNDLGQGIKAIVLQEVVVSMFGLLSGHSRLGAVELMYQKDCPIGWRPWDWAGVGQGVWDRVLKGHRPESLFSNTHSVHLFDPFVDALIPLSWSRGDFKALPWVKALSLHVGSSSTSEMSRRYPNTLSAQELLARFAACKKAAIELSGTLPAALVLMVGFVLSDWEEGVFGQKVSVLGPFEKEDVPLPVGVVDWTSTQSRRVDLIEISSAMDAVWESQTLRTSIDSASAITSGQQTKEAPRRGPRTL